MRRIANAVGILCSLLLLAAGPAAAQDNPSRPVRLVVSFPPGGGVDAVARLFADKMSALLGQTVVVENRGGASGIIAGKQVAGAEPDGTSVLIASNSMVVAQVMSPNVGLDIARDLKALASVAPQAIIIAAQPDFAANTLQELVAAAKARRLNYGSPGAGSVPHLLGVYLFGSLAGVTLEHIPFPGAAQALTALLGKQIDLAMVTLAPAVTLVADGKMKGILVTTPERSAALPKVPTAAEIRDSRSACGPASSFRPGRRSRSPTGSKPSFSRSPTIRRSRQSSPSSASSRPTSPASRSSATSRPSSSAGTRWWTRRG
jgi:tripartite-type tricarboxylate transporter receptor subunit TctC